MTRNILINVPRLNLPGGVANYFRVMRKYLGSEKQYFEIGAQATESHALAILKRSVMDYWQFHRALSGGHFALVHLNPSMVPASVLRDAIFLLIARGHSVPVLIFFRGWDDGFFQRLKRYFSPVFRRLLRGASGIIVLAEEHRNQLQAMETTVPIFCLSTLVDDSIFTEPRVQRARSGPVRILYLSRLAASKGAIEAVRSFALLKQRCPDVFLTVAGDGPERSAVENLAKNLEIEGVVFVGHIEGDAKRQAFQDSDIFFFPTFFAEGMPNAVLEAMAYGLPIVTRPVGGLRDFFVDGQMGLISETCDPCDFAEMLFRLAMNPQLRQAMGDFNRRYALEHFAASRAAARLEEVYARIAR